MTESDGGGEPGREGRDRKGRDRKKRGLLLLLLSLVLLAFSALTAVQARPRMQNVLLAGALACAAAGVTFLVRYWRARRRESSGTGGRPGAPGAEEEGRHSSADGAEPGSARPGGTA